MTTNQTKPLGPEATIFRVADAPFEIYAANPHFDSRDVGVAAATGGAYAAKMFRARKGGNLVPDLHRHDAAFQLVHVLCGEIEFLLEGGRRERLVKGDSILEPKGCVHSVVWMSSDLELFEIYSPAAINTTSVKL